MDTSNHEEFIYDTCPVCGEVRIGHPSIKLMMCRRNPRCQVQYYTIPKDIKTGIEVITYAGWIPDKDSAGRTVYFNPRFKWIGRHLDSIRRDNERKAINLITDWIGGDDNEA